MTCTLKKTIQTFFLCLLPAVMLGIGQADYYSDLIRIIKEFIFEEKNKVEKIRLTTGKKTEIRVKNTQNQLLRFYVNDERKIQTLSYETAYTLYEFDAKGYLIKESRFKKNGGLIEAPKNTGAVIKYQVLDYHKLDKFFQILNEWDGNYKINTIVAWQRIYNAKGQETGKMKLNANEYWKKCNFLYHF